MGTAVWDICQSGSFNNNVRGAYVDGGATTTSTTATDLDNGAAGAGSDIDAVVGHILTIKPDEDMRIRFGGVAATASAGILLTADVTHYIEVSHPGTVSIIDVA